MAKTHRRTSFRRSKRWNPSSRYQSESQASAETVRYGRKGRNPGTFTRYLGDGSKVSVADDGQVTVTDQGGVFSRYRIGHGRLAHFLRDLKGPAKRSNKYDYQGESIQSEGSYSVSLNPGRRGHRGSRKKNRRVRGSKHGHKYDRRSRGRASRRNPRIKRSEAKAMSRVLKRHGYKCKGRKSRSKSRKIRSKARGRSTGRGRRATSRSRR